MYQIKFLKTLTLQRNPILPPKYKPKPKDPAYELTTTLSVTNDLGEQFYYGDVELTVQARYFIQNSPTAKHEVINITTIPWTRGKRSVDVKIPFSMRDAPAGGYVALHASVDPKAKMVDAMNYGKIPTETLIEETFEGLDTSFFKTCDDTSCGEIAGPWFLATMTNLLQVPKTIEELPLKGEYMAIREIQNVLLYEEMSGTIARHLWDAGVMVNCWDVDELAKFMSLGDKQFTTSSKINILELGTGIGLVAVHLTKAMKRATVLATDLEDAEEICNQNINLNGVGKRVKFSELDWESPTSTGIKWDVIIITDCIYNPLYFEPLINVLKKESGPETHVVLAHKFREPYSESQFFPKIDKFFRLRKQRWSSREQKLIHMGLYTLK